MGLFFPEGTQPGRAGVGLECDASVVEDRVNPKFTIRTILHEDTDTEFWKRIVLITA